MIEKNIFIVTHEKREGYAKTKCILCDRIAYIAPSEENMATSMGRLVIAKRPKKFKPIAFDCLMELTRTFNESIQSYTKLKRSSN